MITSLVAQTVKRLSTMWETWVQALDWEDSLEKEVAIHSSNIAWKISWTEEHYHSYPMANYKGFKNSVPKAEGRVQAIFFYYLANH